jgi:hypothetical protein
LANPESWNSPLGRLAAAGIQSSGQSCSDPPFNIPTPGPTTTRRHPGDEQKITCTTTPIVAPAIPHHAQDLYRLARAKASRKPVPDAARIGGGRDLLRDRQLAMSPHFPNRSFAAVWNASRILPPTFSWKPACWTMYTYANPRGRSIVMLVANAPPWPNVSAP